MVSLIIYLLGFITMGLVAGVFIVASIELDEIDEISETSFRH